MKLPTFNEAMIEFLAFTIVFLTFYFIYQICNL
jgi:hypothetical protein